ncbi:hypothetical protein H8356DRAFT_1287310 [Neocallimastix lanati (nom. inval.)]|jgi:hypothetical protein|nr:hypothetical protein H8356DRAFT_1287310 [Neocallimastix sp. JGI-2020a]
MSKINEEIPSFRCFICWDDIDFEDTSTKIVAACNCISPDFKYTHKECLNLWINQNRRSGLNCQVCGTPFHVKKVFKPLKKIYKENWKKINCLIFGMILINVLLWMLCVQWKKELDKINFGPLEDIDFDNLTKYDIWNISYNTKDTYIDEYMYEFKNTQPFQNFTLHVISLFLFVNLSICFLYVYHEKENFTEYSIEDKYEYRRNYSSSGYFILRKNRTNNNININRGFSNNEILSGDNHSINSNDNHNHLNSNEYPYQKIRII